MRLDMFCSAVVFVSVAFAGCTADNTPEASVAEEPAAAAPMAMPPFKEAVPTAVLMSAIEMTAEEYWESVSIVVDKDGEHENFPQTDEEWLHVRAAAIMLAESGNLLMMPAHALDEGDWMRMSQALVDAGLGAARAADAKDFMQVLDEGEKVYNVCTECHEQYMPRLGL